MIVETAQTRDHRVFIYFMVQHGCRTINNKSKHYVVGTLCFQTLIFPSIFAIGKRIIHGEENQ